MGQVPTGVTWICRVCASRYPTWVAWCSTCQSSYSMVVEPDRPIAHALGGVSIRSAKDVVAGAWSLVRAEPYDLPLGDPCFLLVYGEPGSGKSTFAYRLAGGLASRGRVGILAAEEAPGPAMAHRLRHARLDRVGADILRGGGVDDLVDWASSRHGRTLVIDSVTATYLGAPDCRHLLEVAGLSTVIAVAQVLKDGRQAGPMALAHEADAIIHIAGGSWTVEKSRYGPAGVTGMVGLVGEDSEVTHAV